MNITNSFCGSDLWDPLVIYNQDPDFTICFQKTLLKWIPSFILFFISPFWIIDLLKEKTPGLRFTWFTFSKIILTLILLGLEICYFVIAIDSYSKQEAYEVDILNPIISIMAFTLVIIINLLELAKGVKKSIILFMYWFVLLSCSSILLRSNILNSINDSTNSFYLAIYCVYYILIIANFILTIFPHPENKSKYSDPKQWPEKNSSVFSWITIWWLTDLMIKGYKNNLDKDLVWDMDDDVKSKKLADSFENEWQKEIDESKQSDKIHPKVNGNDIEMKLQHSNKSQQRKTQKKSLFYHLLKLNIKQIIWTGVFRILSDLLNLTGPLLVNALIQFTGDSDQKLIFGIFLVILLIFKSIASNIFNQHNYYGTFLAGATTRTILMNLIYRKSLRLSSSAKKETTVGEMINIMQVNTQTFVDLSYSFHSLWSAPITVILAALLCYTTLGPAAFIALGALVVLMPLQMVFPMLLKKAEAKKIVIKDARIKTTNEVLNGIKIVKYYGWETSFQKMIQKLRETELTYIRNTGIAHGGMTFFWGFASFAVTIAAFTFYTLIDENNLLNPSKAFVSLAFFNQMKGPLFLLPQALAYFYQAKIGLKRIENFLLLDEIDDSQIAHEKIDGESITFNNVNAGWSDEPEQAILKDLNFKVETGKLVAVVGAVGSGKSSLISSILGEMKKFTGKINVNGSISFVPQQAWMQNATLKANILFGNKFDENLYKSVLSACSLNTDLNILPSGDSTEIGEKGINLSGGQKQRISLARAIYSDSDIYLLDDPLSAVDAHVGQHIFQQVIGNDGLLKQKTRFFVTNSIGFLPHTDHILMIENGRIVEMGSYAELIKADRYFAKFVKSYFLNREDDDEDDDKLKKTQESNKNEVKLEERSKDETEYKIIQTENLVKGNVKIKEVLDYIKSTPYIITITFFVSFVLMNIFQALGSFWLSDWSNKAEKNDTYTSRERLTIYSLIGIGQFLFNIIGEAIMVFFIVISCKTLHDSMLKSVLRSKMSFFESTPIGRIINRFSKDINLVEFDLPIAFKTLSYGGMETLTIIIMVSISTPLFLAAFVVLFIGYFMVQRFYVSSSSQLKRLDSVSRSPIFSHFGETLSGVSSIRSYKVEDRFIKTIEKRIDENNQFYYPSYIAMRWLAIRLLFIGDLVTIFASIFVIATRGSISPGLAGLAITYSLNVPIMLNLLTRSAAEFESYITSVERIKEYSNTEHEAEWVNEDKRPPKDWPQSGAIDFVNYSIKYRDDLDYALRDINCSIKPTEKIGIVGRTGAGKSSLSLALFRILEIKEGSIIIDDINIKNIGLHDLRQKLTIIPQDPVLFAGTLRINLDPFEIYSDQEIWNALEKANLKEFVESLNEKLLYEILEGGENLSIGQRQLFCLARALLRNTKIIILDEATAAIDHNTDELIQTTIRKSFSKCTILTIAHRLNTIMDSDRILVLDKGRIVEFDPPKVLLSNPNSIFYSMAQSAGIIS